MSLRSKFPKFHLGRLQRERFPGLASEVLGVYETQILENWTQKHQIFSLGWFQHFIFLHLPEKDDQIWLISDKLKPPTTKPFVWSLNRIVGNPHMFRDQKTMRTCLVQTSDALFRYSIGISNSLHKALETSKSCRISEASTLYLTTVRCFFVW